MQITRIFLLSVMASVALSTSGCSTAKGKEITSAKAFYFGHSLVGHDLPQMLGGFARARGKTYAVNGQIGFGTSLQSQWRWQGRFDSGFVPIGFPEELPGSKLFGPSGHEALTSGDYDVIVLTETNGFVSGSPGQWNEFCTEGEEFGGCSIPMATNLIRKARQHNRAVRVFIYTNWKGFEDELGGIENWAPGVEKTAGWWENLADKVEAQLASEGVSGPPIQIIPSARILARIVSEARSGKLSAYGINGHTDFFTDNVHLSRTAFYIVALTHYCVIFRESPVGLPSSVDVMASDKKTLEVDGFKLDLKLAAYFQTVVWEEMQAYARSGVRKSRT